MTALLQDAAVLLGLAVMLDLVLGEPPISLHPVVWMGSTISACMRLRPASRPWAEFAFGLAVAVALPALVAVASYAVLAALGTSPWMHAAASVWLLTSSFSIRGLGAAGERVRQHLYARDLGAAQSALDHLCSRKSCDLSESEVAGATIESVAENACDSFVAPVFFYLLLGVPGALAYRCINTLDSRLGYRGALEYVGKASARIDDVANYIPARLSALLFLASGALQGARVREALGIWRRDANTTESPNAGQTMSVMAGLLGVQLEKRNCYSLGDALRPADAAAIGRAWDIVLAALLMWTMVAGGVLLA